jgi:hypothetical protein
VTAARSGGAGKRLAVPACDPEERAGAARRGGHAGLGGYGGVSGAGDWGKIKKGYFASNRRRQPYGDAWAGKSGGWEKESTTCD